MGGVRAEGPIGDQRPAIMLHRIRRYMERQRMSEWREPLWVAVSGGVDSMVLLHVLQALQHPCHVVHVDHGLRGAESEADQLFVEEYCTRNALPFKGVKVEVRALIEERKLSTQMAARELRYEVFRSVVREGPRKLALAHHRDDAIETLFINLIQGMGLHGWRTIPPISGPFIRPLMESSREEIIAYSVENAIEFREDPSNSEQKYLRNKIRHELIPLIESWRPGVRRSLSRSVDLLREMDPVVQEHLQDRMSKFVEGSGVSMKIPIADILDGGAPMLTLHFLLREHGFHPDRLADMLIAMQEVRTGATFSDGGVKATIDRDRLVIEEVGEEPRSWTIGSLAELPEDLPLQIAEVDASEVDLSQGMSSAWLDLEKLQFPLEYRPWRQGDRMKPIGMKGTKLISDILIDAKVPRNEKERVYVLVSGSKIVWLQGYRIGAGFEAKPGTTTVVKLMAVN